MRTMLITWQLCLLAVITTACGGVQSKSNKLLDRTSAADHKDAATQAGDSVATGRTTTRDTQTSQVTQAGDSVTTGRTTTTDTQLSQVTTKTDSSITTPIGGEPFISWVTKWECYMTNSIPPGGGCSRKVLQLSNQGQYRLFLESAADSVDVNAWSPVGALPAAASIASGRFTTDQALVMEGAKVQLIMVSQVTLLRVTGTANDESLANSNQTCGLTTWKLGIDVYLKGPLPADAACQALAKGTAWPNILNAKLTATAQIKAAVPAQPPFISAEPESLRIDALVDAVPFLQKGANVFYRVNEGASAAAP